MGRRCKLLHRCRACCDTPGRRAQLDTTVRQLPPHMAFIRNCAPVPPA